MSSGLLFALGGFNFSKPNLHPIKTYFLWMAALLTHYAATYVKIYNWYAVNDSRGLAPEGWHIPTDFEWTTLNNCLGGSSAAGGPIKEIGSTHWTSPNTGATNISGLTGLPGGFRDNLGLFGNMGTEGYCWTSTEFSSTSAWYWALRFNFSDLNRYGTVKRYGFSVRCVKD